MSEPPLLPSVATWLCDACGWHVNDEILAGTPDCPHGWSSMEGMALADIKALFAVGAPNLSIDPGGA